MKSTATRIQLLARLARYPLGCTLPELRAKGEGAKDCRYRELLDELEAAGVLVRGRSVYGVDLWRLKGPI